MRSANGYRQYDASALLRLVRVRRLRALGLSLPEIRDALGGEGDRDLREVLGDVVDDLARQEEVIRAQRERLSALLDRADDLTAPDVLAELLAEVRRVVPDEALVSREGDVLELLEATLPAERFATVVDAYRAALNDPEQVERSVALARRFDALAGLPPDSPEVAAVASGVAELGREMFTGQVDSAVDGSGEAVWSTYRASLSPAQQQCLDLAEREAGW